MKGLTRQFCTLIAFLAFITTIYQAASYSAHAQTPNAFSLEQVLDYPFPDNLTASPTGSAIAWSFVERGARNVYAAIAPDFTARRVTAYEGDEGQELTNLSFSVDGRTLVYVRGGDHGANWPADGNLQPDPNGSPVQARRRISSVSRKRAWLSA
jgi:hypothetical protein